MSDSADDPVVREIPVYLSTELSDVLYLIQHPLFSSKRVSPGQATGEPPVPATARLRPRHGKLELTTPLDRNDYMHYDDAAPVRQRLSEHKAVSHEVKMQAHLAIGAMRAGALHLTPVRRVLQMRNTLDHVDAADEREVAEMETVDDDDDFIDDSEDPAAASRSKKDKSAASSSAAPPTSAASAG